MLKGDLASAPLAEVLRQLAAGGASGCVHLADPAGELAKVWLRGGAVYAVLAPGDRPALGARLVSSGALAPEALAEALEAQRTELQGWRLGELLVHLGYVDQPVVEAYVNEQVRDSLAELVPWGSGTWRFRVNERTRDDVAAPVPVDVLLAEVSERRATWASLLELVRGPDAVPALSVAGTADTELSIDADAWSLLCQVDGVRTITDLARDCGFTLYEAGRVVHRLVETGLLEVEDPQPVPAAVEQEAAVQESEPASLAPPAVAARLVSALTGRGTVAPDVPSPDVAPTGDVRRLGLSPAEEDVSGSISRISVPLDALLGPATAGDDLFAAPVHRPPVPRQPIDPVEAERARRDAARRARDAEELAAAQAQLEAGRRERAPHPGQAVPDPHVTDVVDVDGRGGQPAGKQAGEPTPVTVEVEVEAALAAAEAAAEADEARLAQEAEEALLAEQARLAEEARLAAEAEQARLTEQARLAAEAEQARLAQEAEQDRLTEQTRLAAEAEQARLAQAAAAAEFAALVDVEPPAPLVAPTAMSAAPAAALDPPAAPLVTPTAVPDAPAATLDAPPAAFATPVAVFDATAHAEAQAAAFAELSASASMAVPVPAQATPVPHVDVVPEEPFDPQPLPPYGHDTDTASLLRELSSLGLEGEPAGGPDASPARPPVTRPVTVTPPKKRKGLFGRG